MRVVFYLKRAVYLISAYIFIYTFATYSISQTQGYEGRFASVAEVHPKASHIIKTLVLDRKFNEFEIGFIEGACKEWEEKTNHVVEFKIVRAIHKSFIDENTIYINKSDKNNPTIFALEIMSSDTIFGYYDGKSPIKSILIVSDNVDDIMYQTVVLHELGHALGLKHNTDYGDINTTMYPSINSRQSGLVKKDIDQFCSIYKCSNE